MRKSKEGLPKEAFAIVGDPNDPETWKLPHHTRAIFRALAGKLAMESTVDWDRMPAAVAALSPGGYRGQRVEATLEQILHAASPPRRSLSEGGERPAPNPGRIDGVM